MTTRAGTLEAEARARYRAVDYRGALERFEEAYRAHREEGDHLGAGRVARTMAWLHGNVYGDWALCNGWMGRATTLLAEAGEDSAEHGWILVLQNVPDADPALQVARSRQAQELGRRHGDIDLEMEGKGWVGLSLVQAGRTEEGMLLLDEVLAAICAGEVTDIFTVEGVICGMFLACERAADVVRAEQWLRAAGEVVDGPHMVGVSAFCRAHYGGILTAAGRWDEAEVELERAARRLDGSYRGMRGVALVRLADLRVRQGRIEEAEELLVGLDQQPDAFRPLAAVQLARGNAAVARDLLERALEVPDIATLAGPVLALLVDVELADGAVPDASRAAERLAELAVRNPSHYLRAAAALARGKVCMAEGSSDARGCIREALTAFSQADMPVELAHARLQLAWALAGERPEVAIAEASAALEAFERVAAARDADAAAALLRALGGKARTGPKGREALTKREGEVLELVGRGLTNPEIAARLYISRKTVEHHVGRILSKLGLRSRAEAAAYATRNAAR